MKSRMKRLKVVGAAACAVALGFAMSGPAMAQSGDQTFTFTSKSGTLNGLGGDGKYGVPYTGWHWTGTSTGETGDGQKTSSTFSCVMMTQPPSDSLFPMHMLCDVKAGDGAYSTTMGCQFVNPATMEASCIGGLYGTGGAYAGRRGSITNHVKSGVSTGTGQWFH